MGDRSMAVDVISEFLHTGGPPLNADDAAIAIVDVLEREGFNLDRVRDARSHEKDAALDRLRGSAPGLAERLAAPQGDQTRHSIQQEEKR